MRGQSLIDRDIFIYKDAGHQLVLLSDLQERVLKTEMAY